MPTITLANQKEKLDGSLRKSVFDMLTKLQENDTTSGAHVEKIADCADPRVRSVRVNDSFRALVFRIDGGVETHYVYVGTYPHDEAYKAAETLRLKTNPVNGVLSLVHEQSPAIDARIAAERAKQKATAEARAKAEVSATTTDPAPVVDATEHDPSAEFTKAGLDSRALADALGLEPEMSERVIACHTMAELEAAVAEAPPWEKDAYLALAVGISVAEVRAELALDAKAPTSTDDDDFLRAVNHPASRMQFTFLGSLDADNEALREIIENGDFQAWTTFLHPTQRDLATRSRTGSWRVSGGAGTGKTVVALHRTKALVDGTIDGPGAGGPAPRVLLTTFTRVLAESLGRQLSVLDARLPRAKRYAEPGVHMAGVDQVTMAVLRHAGAHELAEAGNRVLGEALATQPAPLYDNVDRDRWQEALMRADAGLTGSTATAEFLRAELETVVLPQHVVDKSGYLKASRSGRGVALNRSARVAVWKVIEAYLAIGRREGSYTFPVLGCLAAAVLDYAAENGERRPYDHVVVDEAQDFHVGHWLLLRALVERGPNDLFVSEDGHQRIYGRPTRLSTYGIDIRGRATRLTLNYRTTAENLGLAMGILSGATFVDTDGEVDSTSGYRSARSGPAPVAAQADTLAGELDLAARQISQWRSEDPDASIGVLTHNRRDVDRIAEGLTERGVTVEDSDGPGVHVMTMHSAKGMEFTHVVLARISDGTVPSPSSTKDLSEEDDALQLQRQRSLLYVAASRARDQVLVTAGATPSPLLPAGFFPAASAS